MTGIFVTWQQDLFCVNPISTASGHRARQVSAKALRKYSSMLWIIGGLFPVRAKEADGMRKMEMLDV